MLTAADLPATWAAAEAQAEAAQRRFHVLVGGQILLPLVGITVGAIADAWLGIVAAVAAVTGAALRLLQRSSSVETAWYEARATAETVKSLAWRYAVRAAPFADPAESEDEVDERFADELSDVVSDRELLAAPGASGEITPAMRALRAESPEHQRESYLRNRIDDQLEWYAARSRRFASLANASDVAFYLLSAATIVAGVLLAADIDISRLGTVVSLAAGASGAAIAWSGVRRYQSQGRAYARVASRLSLRSVTAVHQDTPEEWIAFVDAMEEILSREHEQWRSTRR